MGRLANGPNGWIGVDLDRCLAERGHDGGDNAPGKPIKAMVDRVKQWLSEGRNVRIFTARVAPGITEPGWTPPEEQEAIIKEWCIEHLHAILPVTCVKDYYMLELWDDSCVAVEENTGRQLSPSKTGMRQEDTLNTEFQSEAHYESSSSRAESGHSGSSQGPTQ